MYGTLSVIFFICTLVFPLIVMSGNKLADTLSPLCLSAIFLVLLVSTCTFVYLYVDNSERQYVKEHSCTYTGQSSTSYVPVVTLVNNVPITSVQLVTEYFWKCNNGTASLSSPKY